MNAYKCVATDSQIEIIINKSRFIGYCFKIDSEEQAIAQLEAIRKKHFDATHNCYAYVVGELSETARFSDDGEPTRTAGMPIMEVIKHKGLTNVLVIVTRYFGGILLGAGGLVRAYSKSAAEALDCAGVLEMIPSALFDIECEYTLWGKLESFIKAQGYVIYELEFLQFVKLSILCKECQEDFFVKQCTELSDGRLNLVKQAVISYAW